MVKTDLLAIKGKSEKYVEKKILFHFRVISADNSFSKWSFLENFEKKKLLGGDISSLNIMQNSVWKIIVVKCYLNAECKHESLRLYDGHLLLIVFLSKRNVFIPF